MQRILFLGILLSLISCELPKENNQSAEVEEIVQKMNLALATHDLDELLTCYDEEMDWENSYGWTIRNRDTLGLYFAEWLFPQYPRLSSERLSLEYQVRFIDRETAWVDTLQEILSEDRQTVVRTYRQIHLLTKKGDSWLINKTRMWLPNALANPPIEFLSSPVFFD